MPEEQSVRRTHWPLAVTLALVAALVLGVGVAHVRITSLPQEAESANISDEEKLRILEQIEPSSDVSEEEKAAAMMEVATNTDSGTEETKLQILESTRLE